MTLAMDPQRSNSSVMLWRQRSSQLVSTLALCLSYTHAFVSPTGSVLLLPRTTIHGLQRDPPLWIVPQSRGWSLHSTNSNNNNNNSNAAPRRTTTATPTASGTAAARPTRPSFSSTPRRTVGMKTKPTVDPNRPPLNDEIKFNTLRVTVTGKVTDINKIPKDEPLGIMTKAEALTRAKELGNLDLILINENSDPPVAKIADYSKYRYEKEKKAKEVKKNNKSTELKEIKMSYSIDTHDYQVRVKNASKFIMQGNRVKCSILFKGREIQHDALGFELLQQMAEDMKKICTMEGKPKREGKTLSSILCPKPEVTKAANDKKRAEEKAKKKKKAELKSSLAANGGQEDDEDGDEEDDEESDGVDEDDEQEDTILNLDDDDDDEEDVSLEDLLKTDKLTGDLFA
jgi:translation initiation factor IF-3